MKDERRMKKRHKDDDKVNKEERYIVDVFNLEHLLIK